MIETPRKEFESIISQLMREQPSLIPRMFSERVDIGDGLRVSLTHEIIPLIEHVGDDEPVTIDHTEVINFYFYLEEREIGYLDGEFGGGFFDDPDFILSDKVVDRMRNSSLSGGNRSTEGKGSPDHGLIRTT